MTELSEAIETPAATPQSPPASSAPTQASSAPAPAAAPSGTSSAGFGPTSSSKVAGKYTATEMKIPRVANNARRQVGTEGKPIDVSRNTFFDEQKPLDHFWA